MTFFVGTDVGGTFTDLWVADGSGEARVFKTPSTADGIEAVAICTLWSIANPVHELRLKELVEAELPGVFLTLSHQISSVVGEYGRMSTAAANAALGPIAGRYLARLEQTLRGA